MQGDFTDDHPPKESNFRTYLENRMERGITFFGLKKEWSFLQAKCFQLFGFKLTKKFPSLLRLLESSDSVNLKQKLHKFQLSEIKRFFDKTNFGNRSPHWVTFEFEAGFPLQISHHWVACSH